MKKFFLTVLVSVVVLYSVFGQSEEPKDLILVLDTSSSMSDYNEEVSDYLIGPFLREFLRLGDTFHLISFADEPKLELSRRIRETGDVETIIARLLLMYPLVRYTDISSAVDFAESYTAEIPGTRSKKVVFITDGKNNAVPGSDNANITDDEISALLSSELADRFASVGADVDYVTVPLSSDVPGGKAPVTAPPQLTQTPSRETPPAQQSSSNTVPTQTPQPVTSSSGQSSSVRQPESVPVETDSTPQSSVLDNNQERNSDSSLNQNNSQETLPDTSSNMSDSNQITPPMSNDSNQDSISNRPVVSDRSNASGSSLFSNISWPLIIFLILLIALIIGLIIFFMTRRLHSSPGKVVYEASSYNAAAAAPQDISAQKNADMLASYAAGQRKGSGTQSPYTYGSANRSNSDVPINGPLMLSLFVEDQNTAIGRRNIHNAKSGTTLTVGGGKSDFLMFLVPMPQHIAEIHFDGRNCTFVPKKPKYFPDIGSQSVPNCIGKTIRVISDKNYELFVRIERFQDPLLELNRLMNSISLPGLPED
jgi:hypothetical protein